MGNQRLTRPKTATAKDRGSVTVCFRPRSRHCSCYEAVIQRLSKAATMRSRLERIVKLQPVGSQLLAFLSFSRSMPAAIILLIAESSRAWSAATLERAASTLVWWSRCNWAPLGPAYTPSIQFAGFSSGKSSKKSDSHPWQHYFGSLIVIRQTGRLGLMEFSG